ncbi:rod-binding protein [Bradyrhizobium cenepequi]|uniref:rod-binding protein n=1 Tax=Bradyrhizobium cenepequi TaxID=2821403 RepID=UPI00289C8A20|nr:rod-binding protein [Bradyrhizobium cenepequi]
MAAGKLERASSAGGEEFAAAMDRKIEAGALERTAASAQGMDASRGGAIDGSGHATIIKKADTDRAVYRKFEAFVLQTFVESMLPQNASEVFGKGTAGTIWRSMLAEQIGNEMAKGEGIGIARQLAKARHAADSATGKG